MPSRRLYREAAYADGRSASLEVAVSVLVEDGRIAWIRPTDDEPEFDSRGTEIVDASGSTIVPGMVDAHSHLTLPGGAHHIDRGLDPTEDLLRYAEHNAILQNQSGVRWARDVGAPARTDPHDGTVRALTLGLRERWAHRRDRPYIRAAGTWVAGKGYLPDGLPHHVTDGEQLLSAAHRQLDDGADFVKLMLDGPDRGTPPWSVDEVRRVVSAAHERGARVTAHSTDIHGARVCVSAGVDSIEHGFELDQDIVTQMAEQGTALVATLTALKSREAYPRTTRVPRYVEAGFAAHLAGQLETAKESVRLAYRAGVLIAAGSDFGGGSARANQLAWEIEALVDAGLEPRDALAAATRHGGLLLGEPDAGTLREGGPADFFLVHGDPLSDPSAMWRVWRVAWTE